MKLFLLFNHSFLPEQEAGARQELKVTEIINLPEELKKVWSNIPPLGNKFPDEILNPIIEWLSQAHAGDLVLVQGDFGATYRIVRYCIEKHLIPIYATTERVASETLQSDGSLKRIHFFKHVSFRQYE
jgi:hypothetical protein